MMVISLLVLMLVLHLSLVVTARPCVGTHVADAGRAIGTCGLDTVGYVDFEEDNCLEVQGATGPDGLDALR